ncbi:hypothetical protein M9458_040406, partial [Cirrhinus mrigala]
MSADVTEDAAAAATPKKKKGLGSFFKVTTDKAAGPPLQQDQAITFELQPTEVVEGISENLPTSFQPGKEISLYSSHKFFIRASL